MPHTEYRTIKKILEVKPTHPTTSERMPQAHDTFYLEIEDIRLAIWRSGQMFVRLGHSSESKCLPLVPGSLSLEASVIMLCSSGRSEADRGQHPNAPGQANPVYTANSRKPCFKHVEGTAQFSRLFPPH